MRSRLSNLASALTWHARGLVETDAVRRVKFGLRALAQPAEIERRREWARALQPSHPVNRDSGYRVNPVQDLDVATACELGNELAASVDDREQAHQKAFHRNHLLPRDRMRQLLTVALDEQLLQLVASYLGVVPVLADLDYFCSLATPDGTPYSSSQLYHCDDECPTQLKLFIYCDAVTAHDGPLEVVDARQSQMVRDRIGYRYGGRAYRVADATMDAFVSRDEQRAVLGARGTSVLLDTSRCFHRGSRIRESDHRRMVAVVQFAPPNAWHLPLRLARGAPFRHLVTTNMSSLARAVLGEPVA
jgi:hypothetical protein